jgi:very-short-patch-repair endonuclease
MVYTFASTPPSWHRDQIAACFWAKRGAAAGRAAGFLHELPGCEMPPVEVVTTDRKILSRCGIVLHVTKRLPRLQITVVEGIPSTTVERTLLDLAGILTQRQAAIALDSALRRGLTTLGALDHCLFLTARRGRNGCGALRRLVHERIGLVEPPNSGLETVIFEMLKASTLPLPSLQVVIRDAEGRFVARPDFVYPAERLIIQGHSKQWHWGVAAESKDLEQHNALCALGYRLLYLTWSDATRHADRTVITIGRMLNGVAA